MKNRIIKIINILLIISFIFTPLISYAEPVETEETLEAEKGVLRCPPTISDPNVKCSVVDGGNAVEITYGSLKNVGDVQITKRVAKTDEVGKYSVTFNVKGNNVIFEKGSKEAKIILIFDTSQTVKASYDEILKAINYFTGEFTKEPYKNSVDLGIIQFALKSKIRKKFEDDTYAFPATYADSDKEIGHQSHVEKAIDQLLYNEGLMNNKLDENENKYVILLGDGQYWYCDREHNKCFTEVDAAVAGFKKIRDKGFKIHMIQYTNGKDYDEKEKCSNGNLVSYPNECKKSKSPRQYNRPFIQQNIVEKWWCKYGDDYLNNYNDRPWCINKNKLSYEDIFKKIAVEIKEEIKEITVFSEGKLNDEIGDNFTLDGDSGNTKEFSIGDINGKDGASTEPFYIKINPASPTDWYQTNASFTFKYTLNDGTEKKIKCDDNPEVYWIQAEPNIIGCSGEKEQDAPIVKTIKNSYYSIHCEEGYTENGKKYPNFTTAMKVNNIDIPTGEDDKVFEFNLPSGAGFTAEVSLKTNIKCTYRFDTTSYNSDYATLEGEIAKLEKEIESLETSSNNQVLEAGDTAFCKYTDSSGDQLTATMTLGQVSATSSMKQIEDALYGKKAGDVFDVTIKDTDEVYTVTIISITKRDLEKEKYQKILEINSLKAIADEYLTLSSEMALETYKNKFFSLQPSLDVTYKTESGKIYKLDSDDREFQTKIVDKEPKNGEKFNNKDEKPVCQGTENTIKIGDKEAKVLNQTCTGNFWRIMNIEKICLNMKTGKTEKCEGSNKQLDGLNKHYTPLILDEDTKKMVKLDGDIVITLEKAGYDESVNITLKDCKVKGQTSDAYYREIDVTDPFLQKATHGQRTIGSNFKGEYDFVKIISPTIWNSNNPLYTFNLSKVDIATIENDTTNLGKISYLGDDCYISNHKYACTLPHQYKK